MMIILKFYLTLRKKEIPNYIENDIFDFVKKFIKNTKETFDLDSFIQNISNDGGNFYNLIIEIIEKNSDTNENVIERLRKIFIEKNLLKNIEELDDKGEDDDDEEEEKNEERD